MARCVIAGMTYFLFVFLLGFGLGTFRVLLVAPHLGETKAVLLEVPIMLVASWLVCGWCIRRFGVPRRAEAKALMGAVAFALLITAEMAVAVLLFGRSLTDFLTGYRTTPGAIGIAGQVAFGLMPLWVPPRRQI